jgi:Fe-S-cluster-containing dehydrogenase component
MTERKGGGVLFDAHKCIGCRRCEEACMMQAIGHDEDTNTPIVCNHCGICARYCPHECLSVQEVPDWLDKKHDYEGQARARAETQGEQEAGERKGEVEVEGGGEK